MNILYAVRFKKLPETVNVDGREYKIKTDFREWVAFADVASDCELTAEEKLTLAYDLYEENAPRDLNKGLQALFDFFAAEDLPRTGRQPKKDGNRNEKTKKGKRPIFSYLYDSAYILGSFLQYYGIDLAGIDYMHWYKFRALMDALPDKSTVKERVAYRALDPNTIKDNKERARIRKIQQELEIPMEINALTDNDIGDIFGGM